MLSMISLVRCYTIRYEEEKDGEHKTKKTNQKKKRKKEEEERKVEWKRSLRRRDTGSCSLDNKTSRSPARVIMCFAFERKRKRRNQTGRRRTLFEDTARFSSSSVFPFPRGAIAAAPPLLRGRGRWFICLCSRTVRTLSLIRGVFLEKVVIRRGELSVLCACVREG